MLILFSFAAYAGDCTTEFENKNYEKALVECTQEAEKGSSKAQFILGYLYLEGKGVEQDKQKAVFWYTKVAEQGQGRAQFNLGIMYDKGDGIKQDKQKAVYW